MVIGVSSQCVLGTEPKNLLLATHPDTICQILSVPHQFVYHIIHAKQSHIQIKVKSIGHQGGHS